MRGSRSERDDFDPARIDATDTSIWRYRRLFGLDFETPTARLGAGWTPLLRLAFNGRGVLFKLEFLAPTVSFKDRGTAVMINVLAHQGVTHVADDSSGNAGASVAAYAARAGMGAEIFAGLCLASQAVADRHLWCGGMAGSRSSRQRQTGCL